MKLLWPFDVVHPGDAGYALFADAGWEAFQRGVSEGLVCAAPKEMLHAKTYLSSARVRISSLGLLPNGWRISAPNPVSAYFDMLMSRWLADEVIASGTPQNIAPLKVKFRGSMVMLYGESTPDSCKYRVAIDGKYTEHQPDKNKPPLQEFDAGILGRMLKGNTHHAQVIATGVDSTVEHELSIEPLLTDTGKELRLESICVAGETPMVKK